MKEKKTIKQLIVVISLIGLALLGLGTFFMVKDLKHKKESYKVTVHITDVEQVGEDSYLYYVDYTAGGKNTVTLYISLQMTKMHIPAVVRRRTPIKIIRII